MVSRAKRDPESRSFKQSRFCGNDGPSDSFMRLFSHGAWHARLPLTVTDIIFYMTDGRESYEKNPLWVVWSIWERNSCVNRRRSLARPQFFPLTLAWSKQGEGPSRTLNKEGALLWLTGGLLSSWPAYLQLPAIPFRNPSHRSLARRLPPDSACVKALPLALALPLHLCWGKAV